MRLREFRALITFAVFMVARKRKNFAVDQRRQDDVVQHADTSGVEIVRMMNQYDDALMAQVMLVMYTLEQKQSPALKTSRP